MRCPCYNLEKSTGQVDPYHAFAAISDKFRLSHLAHCPDCLIWPKRKSHDVTPHRALPVLLTIVFDGIAYGMLLFILACGLSVTLGLMNFVNLAHGAFAMLGGYIMVLLVRDANVPFLLSLPAAFVVCALAGLLSERLLYRRLYTRSHLDQVLFSIGLVFMASSAADYFAGSTKQLIDLPASLTRPVDLGFVTIRLYRLIFMGICAAIAVSLQLVISQTRFGAQLRAAVDNPRVAAGLGIHVSRIFALTFATGSGLVGLGGAMAAVLFGVSPAFPIEYMASFLIVVTVGGAGSLVGTFCAALLLGLCDVASKYYLPGIGAFAIYAAMVLVLIVRPQGLFAVAGQR